MEDGRVVFKIDGDDSGLQRTVNNTTNALSGLKSTIVKLGLGVILTKTFSEGVKSANEFEASLAKASTLFGDVAVDTENLSDKILELSSSTGQAASSIAGSLYNALSAGVEVTEDMGSAMTFLESATRLSIAGFTDVDTAVTATAKVLNAYGMSVEEASRVGEVLMETQNLGITTVNELGSALATVTPIAASFGVEFEQVGASLAVMTKQGTDTATATTQLRGLISELGQDGTQASKNLQKAFERAGLEYKNFAEYIRDPNNNLQGAIRLLEDEAEYAGLSLSDMFGNVRAGIGALQLAQDEMGVFNTFMEDMASDTHLVDDAYDKMMDTRQNKWARMRQQFKNITISIANSDAVQSVLDDLTDSAQRFLDKIDAWLPKLLDDLDVFYHKTRVTFAYLEGIYDRSFLNQVIKFSIKIIRNELQDIIDKFESGDIFGAVATLVADYYLIKFSFKLASNAMSNLLSGFSGGFGSIGMWVIDGLEVFVSFRTAMKEDKQKEFVQDFLAAFGIALLAGAFLGPEAGALVFGVMFKFLGWLDDEQTDALNHASAAAASNANIEKMYQLSGSDAERAKVMQALQLAGLTAKDLRAYADRGETLGKYLAQGVANGILSESEATAFAVITFADFIDRTYCKSEEIHSPSKVWERYGEYMAEGLALGLSGEEAKKFAKNAVNDLYDMIESEVKSGEMTLEEAFTLIDELRDAEQELASAITRAPEPAPVASTGHMRTSGGSGYNTIEGWHLDRNGTWVEDSFWTKLKENADNFFNAVAVGAEDGIANLFDFSEGLTTIEDGVEVLTEKGQFWADTMQIAAETLMSGFEDFGQSLVDGTASWKDFARAGLNAIASILQALGYQLAAEGVKALATPPDWGRMALLTAGSAAALTAAGLVKGLASGYEYGGIVGGTGITGDKHMIFANAGELILSRAQQGAIASQLGKQSSPNITISFNGQVFGDQQTICQYVYDGIRTAQYNGELQAW